MTTKQIIALLITKLDLTGSFISVVDASGWARAEKQTPQAIVGFVDDSNAGADFGLLTEETYSVIVVANKANESEDIWELIDLVRDTIHEHAWDNLDIEPFIFSGRRRLDSDEGTWAFEITFRTRHVINAVMT